MLPDEETLYNQTMPQMSEQELFGILDAIKNLTGEYRYYGEYPELEPSISEKTGKQAVTHDGMLGWLEAQGEGGQPIVQAESKPLSEQDVVDILQEWSKSNLYRPIKRTEDSMDFEAEVMDKYPQFFGYER